MQCNIPKLIIFADGIYLEWAVLLSPYVHHNQLSTSCFRTSRGGKKRC
jgi:hypothetical protein